MVPVDLSPIKSNEYSLNLPHGSLIFLGGIYVDKSTIIRYNYYLV